LKSLTELWNCLSSELGMVCQTSTTRDQETVKRRFEHEGDSFLTITLANFGQDLQKALDQGFVGHDQFPGFNRAGGLPRFLGGFLDRVFDRKSGRLVDEPCVDAIFAIRQLTLLYGKILLPCSDARNKKAIQGFLDCESDIRRSDRTISHELLQEFKRISLLLFGDVMCEVDRAIYDGEIKPRHGPGATADGLRGNAKFDLAEWTHRLEDVFPYGDNAIPNWRFNYRLDPVDIREPGRERPVKVTLVPKTLKTPRIIAIEPTCMQFMQQAIMEKIVKCLETDQTVAGMVGFQDQTPNQRMAKDGSMDGGLATIDLSEASDRVSNQHVRLMVSSFPWLAKGLDSTRSRKADVPGKGVHRLAKFASMGSALCFPIEAMVFTTVVIMGIQQSQRRQFTRKDIKSYSGKVRVYGDDIIVPVNSLDHVVGMLESFGLKVNYNKTFGTGRFRESCGRDYYAGTDVTPVRIRHVFPSRRKHVTEVVAAVSLRNRLYEAGLWKTAFWMDRWIDPLLAGRYPYVHPESPVLGKVSFLGYDSQRLSPNTHQPQVKGWTVFSVIPDSKVSGEGALLKWFLKRGDEPFADRDHLERAGRPKSVDIRLGWANSL